jgi:hypothetical protein
MISSRRFIPGHVRRHTHLPPGGRFVEARRCRRLGWLGPGGCSFGLPVPPRCISLVRQGCYRALPMGWRAARTLPLLWTLAAARSSSGWHFQIGLFCSPVAGCSGGKAPRAAAIGVVAGGAGDPTACDEPASGSWPSGMPPGQFVRCIEVLRWVLPPQVRDAPLGAHDGAALLAPESSGGQGHAHGPKFARVPWL